jgi:hypothetical protein
VRIAWWALFGVAILLIVVPPFCIPSHNPWAAVAWALDSPRIDLDPQLLPRGAGLVVRWTHYAATVQLGGAILIGVLMLLARECGGLKRFCDEVSLATTVYREPKSPRTAEPPSPPPPPPPLHL